jgi:hypothetical protein
VSLTTFVPSARVVKATPAVIRFQGVDQDGEPADPGTVTVGVTDSKGDVVVAAGSATTGSGTQPRTYTLSVAQTANVDRLTATWTVSGTVVGVTNVEVVGGVFVSVAEIRSMEPALSSASDYTTPVLTAARTQVETMFEDTCNRAFVPRFRVDTLSGDGGLVLVLGRPDVRRIRWVRIADYRGVFTDIDLTAETIEVTELGLVVRRDSYWPWGRFNVQVGYEYGLDQPPADLKQAAVQAIRAQVNTFRSGIPDRATSFQPIDGGNVVLATPGLGPWITGIPSVDECLKRYRWHDVAVA